MLVDAGGMVPRRAVVSAIGTLEQKDRQLLYQLKVRLGPLDVFLPPLLKPAAQLWRAALLAVRSGEPVPVIPPAGAATLRADADPRGASLAYRRAGGSWVRIDLADRLASHAHKVRSAGGENPVDTELATSVGLDDEALARLMSDIGFAKTDDAWRWRGRHAAKWQERRETGSHAFAELAKLRRK
jgi:ATP-dependent RNA helicase SUPV3L1/SUV3